MGVLVNHIMLSCLEREVCGSNGAMVCRVHMLKLIFVRSWTHIIEHLINEWKYLYTPRQSLKILDETTTGKSTDTTMV